MPCAVAKFGIDANRLLKIRECIEIGVPGALIDIRHAAQEIVVGCQLLSRLVPGAFNFGLFELRRDRSDHVGGDFVLQLEHVFERTIETVRP